MYTWKYERSGLVILDLSEYEGKKQKKLDKTYMLTHNVKALTLLFPTTLIYIYMHGKHTLYTYFICITFLTHGREVKVG